MFMNVSLFMLTQQALDELKQIHKKESGEDLTDDEAWAMGERLLRLLDVVTRPPGSKSSLDLPTRTAPAKKRLARRPNQRTDYRRLMREVRRLNKKLDRFGISPDD